MSAKRRAKSERGPTESIGSAPEEECYSEASSAAIMSLFFIGITSLSRKAAMVVFLLAVCCVVMRAQNSAPPSADVTIGISEDTPEYCLGEILSPPFEGPKRGPDDITLRLP
jgi:hypothetical protein